MANYKIYHNPRCSKSRQTLELLENNNIQPEIIEYLKNPPSASELGKILRLLNLKPRQLMRKKEVEYKENGFDNETLSDKKLIDMMVEHPKVIERPIVVTDDAKAVIGRPPENVLELI